MGCHSLSLEGMVRGRSENTYSQILSQYGNKHVHCLLPCRLPYQDWHLRWAGCAKTSCCDWQKWVTSRPVGNVPHKPEYDRRKDRRMDFKEQPCSPPSVPWRRRQGKEALSEVCLTWNALQLSPMVRTLASDLAHFKHPIASGFTIGKYILRDFFASREEKVRTLWDPHL